MNETKESISSQVLIHRQNVGYTCRASLGSASRYSSSVNYVCNMSLQRREEENVTDRTLAVSLISYMLAC